MFKSTKLQLSKVSIFSFMAGGVLASGLILLNGGRDFTKSSLPDSVSTQELTVNQLFTIGGRTDLTAWEAKFEAKRCYGDKEYYNNLNQLLDYHSNKEQYYQNLAITKEKECDKK